MPNPCNRLLARVTAPASEPLTLEEAKLYLRIDHDDDDTLISDLIVVSRMIAEDWLKRSMITQAWKVAYDDYAPETILLPMGPVSAVNNVTIVHRDGATQEVAASLYYLNAARDAVIFDTIILGFRVEVTYATGYGDADAVPYPLKQGMLAHLAAMYDFRGNDGDLPLPEQTVRMYMPFREVRL